MRSSGRRIEESRRHGAEQDGINSLREGTGIPSLGHGPVRTIRLDGTYRFQIRDRSVDQTHSGECREGIGWKHVHLRRQTSHLQRLTSVHVRTRKPDVRTQSGCKSFGRTCLRQEPRRVVRNRPFGTLSRLLLRVDIEIPSRLQSLHPGFHQLSRPFPRCHCRSVRRSHTGMMRSCQGW